MTDESGVEKTFTQFIPTLRYPLKGLVACAGLSRNGPATEFPVSSFRRMLDINVTGTFLIAQAAAREMLRTNTTGSMVFVASMSGYVSNKVGPMFSLVMWRESADMVLGNRASIQPDTMPPRRPFINSRGL